MLMFGAVFGFLVLVGVAFIVVLSMLGKPAGKSPFLRKDLQKEVKRPQRRSPAVRHVGELVRVDDIHQGIYRKGSTNFAMGRISGTNFDVITESEQDARENTLIDIISGIDYPVQFVTTTIVSDTDDMVRDMIERAEKVPEGNPQRDYIYALAAEMHAMKMEHKIMARQSWVIISTQTVEEGEDPVDQLQERMNLLSLNMREKAKILITPVTDSGEALDILHQIMLPESVIKPSERIAAGITEPIHFKSGELVRAG